MIDNTSNVTVMLKKLLDYSFYVKIMPQLVKIQSSTQVNAMWPIEKQGKGMTQVFLICMNISTEMKFLV